MLYEIIFCFFAIFGVMQILSIIKNFFISKIPENVTMIADADSNIDILAENIRNSGLKVVFVYSTADSKKLEILQQKFEYASFIKREALSEEMQKLI